MAVSDVIRIGDKIDVRLVQQIENNDKSGETPEVYRSQVLDIKENGNFEIAMPTEKGRLILLPLGVRFEFVFYSLSLLTFFLFYLFIVYFFILVLNPRIKIFSIY